MRKAFTPAWLDMRRSILLGSLGAMATPLSWAQGTTDAPLRLIVPFTPGTGIDLIARQVGPGLTSQLKRPYFVDNRPGAAGNIGTQEVVRAAPDGSTLLVSVNTLVMNSALYPKLPFNPLTDLTPVTLTSWGQLILVASTQSGIGSLQALMTSARDKPGKLNYGSPGTGTPHHLAMELLKNRAKISLTHISYRGTAPALTDLLGGQIDVMFLPIHVALQHVKAGKLKALGISSDKPNALLPDVPSLQTLNVGNLNVDMWYGVLAPASTPRPVVDRLNKALATVLSQPDVAKAFEAQGMTPAHSTPEEFGRLMAADSKRWADLIKAQGITAE